MRLSWSAHAEQAIRERLIEREWVLETLLNPEFTHPDPLPARTRAYRRIEAYGRRWLRVVYEDIGEERRIVTIFFDRRARRPE
jgi:Domain of unknown function (DUF4258)